MAVQVQLRRGTTAQNNAFTGALGEVSIDTDADSLRVHDGSTAGGFETNAKQAKYADIAERYHADEVYDTGTVVSFGGVNEITAASSVADQRVMGVISTDPYCVMNSPHRMPHLTNEYHPPVALLGRVPTWVTGVCQKGDIMVSSSVKGHAQAWTENSAPPYGSIVGKAVADKTDPAPAKIEVLVGKF